MEIVVALIVAVEFCCEYRKPPYELPPRALLPVIVEELTVSVPPCKRMAAPDPAGWPFMLSSPLLRVTLFRVRLAPALTSKKRNGCVPAAELR